GAGAGVLRACRRAERGVLLAFPRRSNWAGIFAAQRGTSRDSRPVAGDDAPCRRELRLGIASSWPPAGSLSQTFANVTRHNSTTSGQSRPAEQRPQDSGSGPLPLRWTGIALERVGA